MRWTQIIIDRPLAWHWLPVYASNRANRHFTWGRWTLSVGKWQKEEQR